MEEFKGFQGTNARRNNKTVTEELEILKEKFLNNLIDSIQSISRDLSNDNFVELSNASKSALAKAIHDRILLIDDSVDTLICHVRIEEGNSYKTEIGEIKS